METGIVQMILLVAFVFLIFISCLAIYWIGRKLFKGLKQEDISKRDQ